MYTLSNCFYHLFCYTEGIFKADLDDKTFIFRCEEITDTTCCYYLFSVSISKLSLSLSISRYHLFIYLFIHSTNTLRWPDPLLGGSGTTKFNQNRSHNTSKLRSYFSNILLSKTSPWRSTHCFHHRAIIFLGLQRLPC